MRKRRVNLLRLAFLPLGFAIIFVRPPWTSYSAFDFFIELPGYLLLLAGLTIRIWCILYIGGRKSIDVISDGPYSLCRHPLYLGTLLLAFGVGLCFENLLVLIILPLIIIPVHIVAARVEEDHLEARFGEKYRQYKKIVPRFLPRFSNYNSPRTIQIDVHSIKRIAFDTVAVLLIPQIEELLELLHENGVIPVLWHFPH